MSYHQFTSDERYTLARLRQQHFSQAEIARILGRHPSTISRELKRNRRDDGWYRAFTACERTRARRTYSRRNWQFTEHDWALVTECLYACWSPDQISQRLKLHGLLSISHETIYRYIWNDRRTGGRLHTYLRHDPKQRRKRYGRYDSRGRLAGKRSIGERPAGAENRSRVGHLEGDTMIGSLDNRHCIMTLVDRKTGYVFIGKMRERTVAEANRVAIQLIHQARRPVLTLTLDNGTEFHGYKDIERETGVTVYFATPHHSWERGTSENTNGLIRQYLPKRTSMAHITQRDCDRIASALNHRPRKRLGYLTPAEVYEHNSRTPGPLHFKLDT